MKTEKFNYFQIQIHTNREEKIQDLYIVRSLDLPIATPPYLKSIQLFFQNAVNKQDTTLLFLDIKQGTETSRYRGYSQNPFSLLKPCRK
jgi:hypothetical protein